MDHSREDIEQAQAELQRRIGAAEGAEAWDDSREAAAGEFVSCLLDGGVDRREIMGRLGAAGVSGRGARALLKAAIRARARDEKKAEEAELAGATPICPHCLAPLGQFDHFCPKCAGPVTALASTAPMGQIYSAGRAYRLAVTDKRPRGIVVLAMWLIFGPGLLSVLWALYMCASSWGWISPGYDFIGMGDATAAIWLILILGVFVLYSAILTKVTVHWLQSRRQADDGPVDDAQADDAPADEGHPEASDQ